MPPTRSIIRVDSVQRYCDIIDSMPPRKQIYYELAEKYGNLWGNYTSFVTRLRLGYRYTGDEIRGKFISEFISRVQEEISPVDIFDQINEEYMGLWKSYTHFLKEKSRYKKHKVINL